MYQLTILFAPETQDKSAIIKDIVECFAEKDLKITALAASGASIVDILSADIFIFALDKASAAAPPDALKEILRAFSGINLAGRLAGFIRFDSEEFTGKLRKALKNTNVCIIKDDLVIDKGKLKRGRITGWAQKVYQTYKDFHRNE